MPRWRILIVDDEPDVRAIIRGTLAKKYEVVEAEDGLDALEKIDLAEPDFVVLDVMMPLMDGFEACAAIRKRPRFANTPVLYLSALNTKDDMKKGYGQGANLYLTKPFEPSRLLRNVELFFEKMPGPSAKRHTLEELAELQKQGPERLAEARVQTVTDSGAHPAAAASSPAQPAAAPKAPVPPAPDQSVDQHPSHGILRPGTIVPRVLLVDDNPEILQVMRASLSEHYEVVLASNGIEAIEKITGYQPDLIVMDAMMPKMSGYQLCQSLRRNPRYVKTPVMFVSAKNSPKDKEYALRIGANDFLGKPFDPHILLQKLQALTQLPDFRIHQKTLSYGSIEELENQRRREFQEREDRLHRKEETELEKFLKEHS